MSDPVPTKITRLGELPRDIPPPRDGWPALEARLRESGALSDSRTAAASPPGGSQEITPAVSWRSRRSVAWLGAIAAAVVAVAAGISVDRLILQGGHPHADGQRVAHQPRPATSATGEELPASFITDPRYLAERAALLASLDERLKTLPPQTRQQVLASLATIHRSMQQIQQALGREPANALLQELLIDTYQDEMRVLTAVQEAGTGSGES
ncbi:MAG TPA: hypothetical protein VGI35_03865 [Steroidobacteraceae bacterium]|jgi:hypothetical protein